MPLPSERIGEIESLAEEMLKNHWNKKLPVNIEDIARFQKFDVQSREFPDPDDSGFILVDDDTYIGETGFHRIIAVNSALSEERARFVVAHELGHFTLHRQPDEPLYAHKESREEEDITPEMEQEADLFARALLMSRQLMRNAFQIYKEKAPVDSIVYFISRIFGVTEKKAAIRIQETVETVGTIGTVGSAGTVVLEEAHATG